MDTYDETFELWNKLASLYEQKFMDLELYNTTYDAFLDSIASENADVLEIACGPGNITKYLLTKRPQLRVFGTDIAPNMIELARKNNPSARFECMDSRNISELETRFDGIVCGFCIPYLTEKDCEKLIFDSSNLLNENGVFYLSFVEGAPQNSAYQTNSRGERMYFKYYLLNELQNLLQKNNFKEIHTFRLEYKKSADETETHTVLIGRKENKF